MTQYVLAQRNVAMILEQIEVFFLMENYIEDEYYKELIVPVLAELINALTVNFNEKDVKSAKKEDISKLIKLVQKTIKHHFEKTELSSLLLTYELDILLL